MQALECATRDADRGLPALTLARYALELPELSQLAWRCHAVVSQSMFMGIATLLTSASY